jgi:hypothetical protein
MKKNQESDTPAYFPTDPVERGRGHDPRAVKRQDTNDRDSSGSWYLDEGGASLAVTREKLQERVVGLFQSALSTASR